MKKIIIVEDELPIAELEKDYLELSDFEVTIETDGIEGEAKAMSGEYDLLILDVMLPGQAGFEICRKYREKYLSPVTVVSAKKEDIDKIHGLGLGADDYRVKPFLPKELSLRIGIILRRYYKGEDPIVQLAGSQIDFDRAEVIKENEHFPLTAKEHDILLALYRNAGRIVTIDQLCEAAWGDNPYGYENSLMAHIRRIREKIEANPSKPVSLITVKGLGYKLVLAWK